MSRSGYVNDGEQWQFICWRGAVSSALGGKRGQAFLREMLEALDSLPEPRLISDSLSSSEESDPKQRGVCAMGAVGLKRGVKMDDYYYAEDVGNLFGISRAMAAEISWINDESFCGSTAETPEDRFVRVRKWVKDQIVSGPEA